MLPRGAGLLERLVERQLFLIGLAPVGEIAARCSGFCLASMTI